MSDKLYNLSFTVTCWRITPTLVSV